MIPTSSLVTLENLARFEETVQHHKIKSHLPVKVRFIKNNQWLQIEQDGWVFVTRITNQIIHQLTVRIFQTGEKTLSACRGRWNEAFQHRFDALQFQIADGLRKNELFIYYYCRFDEKIIYGIVSDAFEPMDQIEFRNLFVAQAKQTGLLDMSSTFVNQYGRLIELFDYKDSNGRVKLSYLLHHAKNNGYNGIKISWGRVIIVCSNGLTKIDEEDSMRWKHLKSEFIGNFVRTSLLEGIQKKLDTEERIEKAMTRKLSNEIVSHFFQRLHLAEASKERVRIQLNNEIRRTGNNEWSLSQALTWTGTHEKDIMLRPKQLLTEAGSMILDHSLRNYLTMDVYTTGEEKAYGPLLQKKRAPIASI